MQKTNDIKLVRIYVGTIPYLPADEQIRRCTEAAEALGLPANCIRSNGPGEWDEYVKALRKDEVAMVARLVALDERPLPSSQSAGDEFSERVSDLEVASLFVMDVEAGLRSTDKRKWREHRRATRRKITRGRNLKKSKAQSMARARHKAHPGIVAHWLSLEGTPIYKRVAQHWRDPQIPNAEIAIATAPEEAAELRTSSPKTWERCFGGRRGTTKPSNT